MNDIYNEKNSEQQLITNNLVRKPCKEVIEIIKSNNEKSSDLSITVSMTVEV